MPKSGSLVRPLSWHSAVLFPETHLHRQTEGHPAVQSSTPPSSEEDDEDDIG